ncbi:prepilin-type N-terminal cleavage/methylation domain-containing protein [Thiomicrorhabdus xiamenensis]|uniref:Prepilin-type N-terminal cleavage/methylation domain-containing protein n=2 Tax=Thiomicrorhabdus xiamenensis TaxID=2739063 RepID=A0A7D4ST70_9GAMM|nr:prepilin-type N-terminal cleavage/methylation domain-containing protein [Thiomicrorhabdus xiamenensis]
MKAQRHAQKGFTLVEIAIVLVIIGLLLGGVLKGQEMINSAKIKSDTDALKSLQASAYAYRDRMGFYPGSARSTTPTDSTLNGTIIQDDISSSTDVPAIGDNLFFSELYDQGFLKGVNPIPEIDEGGAWTAGQGGGTAVPALMGGNIGLKTNKNYICITLTTDTSAEIVTGMDIKLDDGEGTTGIVITNPSATPTTTPSHACLEM